MERSDDQGFQKPATRTLWIAPTSALYAGPLLGVGMHRGAVVCLAEADGATLTATTATGHSTGPSAAVLVAAGVTHRIDGDCERALLLYLHPTDAIVRGAAAMLDAVSSTREVLRSDQRVLRGIAPRIASRGMDPRVRSAIGALDAGRDVASSVELFAGRAGLSPSRFMHLFADATGVPFRRYRLWARVRFAALAVARNASLTTAALDAGFATPSHFSETFRGMFGVAPSSLRAMTIVESTDTGASIRAALTGA